MKSYRWSILVAGLFGLALALSACEGDKDYDRPVPPGLGTLMIDNETYDDISVFVDSEFQERIAREDHVTSYDFPPGVYRVVLEQRGGRDSYRGDIDLLPDRRTVIEVFPGDFDSDRFAVRIFFD